MSADYYIGYENLNVTYNLGPMLRAAGFPAWKALVGAPASEAGGMLRTVADRLRADPDRFKELNPPNGWGTYEWALDFLDRFAEACATYPDKTIEAWL